MFIPEMKLKLNRRILIGNHLVIVPMAIWVIAFPEYLLILFFRQFFIMKSVRRTKGFNSSDIGNWSHHHDSER